MLASLFLAIGPERFPRGTADGRTLKRALSSFTLLPGSEGIDGGHAQYATAGVTFPPPPAKRRLSSVLFLLSLGVSVAYGGDI